MDLLSELVGIAEQTMPYIWPYSFNTISKNDAWLSLMIAIYGWD